MRQIRRPIRFACLAAALLAVALGTGAGCNRREANMRKQPKYAPLQPSEFFEDGRSSRPLVDGTVAQGHAQADSHFFTGRINGQLADSFPAGFPTRGVELEQKLRRGQERYAINCVPCHGRVGDGNGMIVQRGFTPPPTYHQPRLRNAPVGHFFEVITKGIGAMYDYAERVSPEDRWAIAAYIRALQLSQDATGVAGIPTTQSGGGTR